MSAIRISEAVAQAIREHCVRDYPAECCGLLIDGSDGPEPRPCRNIQDELHRRDPEAHPRTSRNAYRMDDVEVQRALRDAESAGRRLVAFYHSHIDCDAYFSHEDQAAALFLGEPAYPGVAYLVFSVREAGVAGQAAFVYDHATRGFVRVPLLIED